MEAFESKNIINASTGEQPAEVITPPEAAAVAVQALAVRIQRPKSWTEKVVRDGHL
jgi:hypothetical protein